MVRLLLLSLGPLIFASILHSQSLDYGNTWYTSDPNRTFIKLQVWQDGLYRIAFAELLAAGHDLSGVDPAHLQLWYRGVEQSIHVVEDSIGDLAFLEFLGQRNDGATDSFLYRNPITGIRGSEFQPHPEISLFSDTSTYFLTWDGTVGMRYQQVRDSSYSQFSPQTVYPFAAIREYHPDSAGVFWVPGGGGTYDSFHTLNSDYVTGEGYAGPQFFPANPLVQTLSTPAPANPGSPKLIQIRMFGRSNTSHAPKVSLDGTVLLDTSLNNNQVYLRTFERSTVQTLTSQSSFLLESQASGTDRHHLLRLSIRYLRFTDLLGEASTQISQWQSTQSTKFVFTQVAGTDSIWIIDVNDGRRYSGEISGDSARIVLPDILSERDLFVFTDQAIQSPLILPDNHLRQLCAPDSGTEFLIIAHRDLEASAHAYAMYRDTNSVNSFPSKVVFTDEIYEEFGYGSPTPWAIKRFINCALENWTTPPQYILLWGKGYARIREFAGPIVPTYGYPSTDYPFVEPYLPDSNGVLFQIPIGRINLTNNTDGLNYLNKVDIFEHQGWDNWRRYGLFLGGGANSGEQSSIQSGLANYRNVFEGSPFHGLSRTVVKSDQLGSDLLIHPDSTQASIVAGMDSLGNPIFTDLSEDSLIFSYVSNGVSWIQYFGHSTSNLQEIRLGEPDDFGNIGRFPFLFFQGCYGVNPASTSTPIYAERWMFEPMRGSIGAMGTTSASYLNPLKFYGDLLFVQLFADTLSRSIGEVLLQIVPGYLDSVPGILSRNQIRQMMLHCDPAIQLFPVPANPSPSPVWPGDANHDGVADIVDLLNIGLSHGQMGDTRPGSLSWYAQPALDWANWFIDSTNMKHADCDGNGTVEDIDTLGISLNYGSTHNKTGKSNFFSTGLPVYLVYPDSISEGDTILVEVLLGDEINQDSLYGIALQVQFDPEIVQDSLVWVDMDQGWLGTPGQNLLTMNRPHVMDGLVDLAATRTDHVDTVGYGKLADISIVITDDIAKKERAAFLPWLNFGYAVNAEGEEVPLLGITTTIESGLEAEANLHIFPNPASERVFIQSSLHPIEDLSVFDVSGKLIHHQSGLPRTHTELIVRDWPSGIYLLQMKGQETFIRKKISLR